MYIRIYDASSGVVPNDVISGNDTTQHATSTWWRGRPEASRRSGR